MLWSPCTLPFSTVGLAGRCDLPNVHAATEPRPAQPLADLLGRTRAAILSSIEHGRTTTQVAEHVGISPGSASQHASVLRSAGLVSTRRVGQSVLHALTPPGRRLMDLNR